MKVSIVTVLDYYIWKGIISHICDGQVCSSAYASLTMINNTPHTTINKENNGTYGSLSMLAPGRKKYRTTPTTVE